MALPSRLALFLVGSVLFTAAYCQAPLYYSNQNQYFLHGLARAGHGVLDEDWLANTHDPTPAFSTLVALTARHLHPLVFHLYHGLLLGAYAAAMLGLFAVLAGEQAATRRWLIFVVLFVAVHSGLARWLSYRLVGFDYPWFLQAGVAGQYVLGAMLQPSVFGVLLVVAICLFVRGRPYLAAVCIGLAADMHSTYLLPGAMLTLGFLSALLQQRQIRQAIAVAAIALILVLPAVGHALWQFRPTSAEQFAQAQDILVNLRIPHHCRVDLWLDWVAGLQILWFMLALVLTFRTALFPVLAVPFVLAVLLTLVQVMTASHTLALLFPWRISAILVPIATTVILARLVAMPSFPLETGTVRVALVLGIIVLVAAGVVIRASGLAFRGDDDELALLAHVRNSRSPGDRYLLPVRVPNLAATTRGSLSSDFKPLARKKLDERIIPIDLQRFRLMAGAAIFVDFKSIPYKDIEVLEWRRRLQQAQSWHEELAAGRASDELLAELHQQGITHLVTPANRPFVSPALTREYEDAVYHVYRLQTVRRKDEG
jgi:hypothetical protein